MGVDAGDVVTGHPATNQPVIHVDEVVERRGWDTVRVLIIDPTAGKEIIDKLTDGRNSVEHAVGSLWAVGIAPRGDPQRAMRLLEEGAAGGAIRWEWGRSSD